MNIVAEKVCENCGGVVDAPEFRFDTCELRDGDWLHYLNGERVPRHVYGVVGDMQLVIHAAS